VSLEFLSVPPEAAVVAESPLADIARRAGAELEVRDGWLVPTSFGDDRAQRAAIGETVGFADTSGLRKLELQGSAEALRGAWPAGEPQLGVATADDGGWWCPLTPTLALVLGTGADLEGVDVTSQYCALRLAGPLVRELMACFCALDLRPGVAPPATLLPGSVARTPGLVIVEAEQRLLVLVGAAYAEYLWTTVADAAARLGGRPVGSDLIAAAVNA
jgi:glycine cleavage system aminomethyltransferase T